MTKRRCLGTSRPLRAAWLRGTRTDQIAPWRTRCVHGFPIFTAMAAIRVRNGGVRPMNMGIAWYLAHPVDELDRQPRAGSSDREYYRALGIDVDAPAKRHPLQRRTTKLRSAIPATVSVFRELM